MQIEDKVGAATLLLCSTSYPCNFCDCCLCVSQRECVRSVVSAASSYTFLLVPFQKEVTGTQKSTNIKETLLLKGVIVTLALE